MGKFYKPVNYLLGLLCASAFAVQALAVESTARVSTSIDAASGYRGVNSSTIRTPSGTNIRPLPSVQPPNVSKMASGGLQQAMRGTVSANDGRFSTVLNMRVRATNATLKGGAKSLLKGGLAGVALTVGFESFLDGLDWVMGEGGQIQQKTAKEFTTQPEGTTSLRFPARVPADGSAGSPICSGGGCVFVTQQVFAGRLDNVYCHAHAPNDPNAPFVGFNKSVSPLQCYYQAGASPDAGFSTEPIPLNQIDAAVDAYYEPEPEDWPLLSPRIEPDDVEIYDLPGTIPGEPETIIEYDPQGNPQTTTVKQPAYDLVPRENPSPQPALDLETKLETRTYNEHGELTSIVEATSTAPAVAGGGGEPPDIPTDCAFMPTVCAFLEWFQEPDPEVNTEPDLSVLRDELGAEDLDRDFQVGATTAGCPPPLQISFFMFPNTEVSLQPLCDFVDLLRPLVLMLAFFTASTIVLRS